MRVVYTDRTFEYCECTFRKWDKESYEETVNNKDALIEHNKANCGFSKRDIDEINGGYRTDTGNIDAYEKACRYGSSFNDDTSTGLYIYGRVGVGKSLLAKKVMTMVLNKGYSAYITNVIQLMKDMKKEIGEFIDDTYRKCIDTDLLVVDDLGTERNTEYDSEQIYDIINERYENKKPTLFTSNLSIDDLKTKYDEYGRVYSRIKGTSAILEIRGEDKRQNGKKA